MYFLPHSLPGNSTPPKRCGRGGLRPPYAPPLTVQSFFGYLWRFTRSTPKDLATLSMILFLRLVIAAEDGSFPVCSASARRISSSGVPLPKCSKKKSCYDSVHSSSMTRRASTAWGFSCSGSANMASSRLPPLSAIMSQGSTASSLSGSAL